MLPEERRSKLIALLNENGSARIEDLARAFDVSEMTIRRDLERCRPLGTLQRCHGGVMLRPDNVGEVDYSDKLASNLEAKQRIAAYCAELVSEGMQIFLDAGTTAFCIAKALLPVPGITYITNDLETALLLSRNKKDVIITGGHIQNSTGSAVGPVTCAMVSDLFVDIAFVGAASINDAFEVLTPTLDKAFLKRVIQANAKECFLVADASKFHRSALVRIGNCADYTAVVTDAVFTEEEKKLAQAKKIELIHV